MLCPRSVSAVKVFFVPVPMQWGGGIEVHGRTSVGRGTGAVGEAFRAPEMKDAGGGARAGRVAAKALEAPVKGGAEGGAGRIAEVFVAPTKKGT